MSTEKLTEDEREAVRRGTCQASGPKALRIIDALTAENERLRACQEPPSITAEHWMRRARDLAPALLAAESRLATAVRLLHARRHDAIDDYEGWNSEVDDLLASAQPAAPARTEAEQAPRPDYNPWRDGAPFDVLGQD
jgi:hypothetical protein